MTQMYSTPTFATFSYLAGLLLLVLQVIFLLRGLVKHRPAQPRGLADPPEMWFEQVPVQSLKINTHGS